MFNFKSPMAGKVFKKLSHMDKKQAYTYGAIAIVALVALLTLASAAGSGPDDSFDDLQGRGYDLAQMPFVNDEAEQFLLASKYPDMRNNNVNAIYSKEEKEARQAEDAAKEEEKETSSTDSSSSSGYTGYSRGGGSGAARTPTQIGSFTPSSSMASASGGNTSATFGGTVKGDFSPFQREDKGREAPFVDPNNARQALARFNSASRAAARGANKARDSQKALFGSHVSGTGGFDSNGVPLKGTGSGVNYEASDTPDLSGLDDTMQERATDAREKAQEQQLAEEESIWRMFGEALFNAGLDLAKQWAGNKINQITAMNQARSAYASGVFGASPGDLKSGKEAPLTWVTGENLDSNYANYQTNGYVTFNQDSKKWVITDKGASYFQNQIRANADPSKYSGNIIGNGILNTPTITLGNTTNRSSVNSSKDNKSWTEYENCKKNKGPDCDQYKP